MAEGIYNEDGAFLARVRDAVAEKDRLTARVSELKSAFRKLEKDAQTEEKSIRDEIESTVKKRRGEVEDSFDRQIGAVKSKRKKADAEKERLVDEGKASRIREQSREHVEDSREAERELKSLFRKKGVPGFARTKLFYVMFMPDGLAELGMMIVCYAILFLGIPAGVTLLANWLWLKDASDQTKTVLSIVIPAVLIVLFLGLIFLIYVKVKSRHIDTIRLGRRYRTMVRKNDRKIREIKRDVEKDTDESQYDLGDVNERLAAIISEEEEIREQKNDTLKRFDEETAVGLKQEIEERRNPHLAELIQAKEETGAELEATEKALQDKSLEISQDYVPRVGEEFLKPDKLEDLISILQSGEADTISGAIAYYKNPNREEKPENQ
jgi:hypothetical protein